MPHLWWAAPCNWRGASSQLHVRALFWAWGIHSALHQLMLARLAESTKSCMFGSLCACSVVANGGCLVCHGYDNYVLLWMEWMGCSFLTSPYWENEGPPRIEERDIGGGGRQQARLKRKDMQEVGASKSSEARHVSQPMATQHMLLPSRFHGPPEDRARARATLGLQVVGGGKTRSRRFLGPLLPLSSPVPSCHALPISVEQDDRD